MKIQNILYKCHKCSTLIKGISYSSGNTIGGIQFSDQYVKAPMAMPDDAGWIGCPSCKGVFTAEEMVEVVPDDDEYKNAQAPLPRFEANKILLEDPTVIADEKKWAAHAERYVRSFNHELMPEEQMEEKKSGKYQKYTKRLVDILGKMPDNLDAMVMCAEILRECGEFDKAITILNSVKLPESRQHLSNAAKQIKAKAEGHDSAVFEIKPLQV